MRFSFAILFAAFIIFSSALLRAGEVPRDTKGKSLDLAQIYDFMTPVTQIRDCTVKIAPFEDGRTKGTRIEVTKQGKPPVSFYYIPHLVFWASESAYFWLPEVRPEMGHLQLFTNINTYAPPEWDVAHATYSILLNYDYDAKKFIGGVFERGIQKHYIGSLEHEESILCGDTGNFVDYRNGNWANPVKLKSRLTGNMDFWQIKSKIPEKIGACEVQLTPHSQPGNFMVKITDEKSESLDVDAQTFGQYSTNNQIGSYLHQGAKAFSSPDIAAYQVWDWGDKSRQGKHAAIFYYDYSTDQVIGAVVTQTIYPKGKGSSEKKILCGNVGAQPTAK